MMLEIADPELMKNPPSRNPRPVLVPEISLKEIGMKKQNNHLKMSPVQLMNSIPGVIFTPGLKKLLK
jgi:hypothetical protein